MQSPPLPCSPAPSQAGSEREEVVRLARINIRDSTNAATDIQCLIHDANAPDVLILTETKRKKPQSMCKDTSSRYTGHNSNTPTGNGGLTMLLDRKYSTGWELQRSKQCPQNAKAISFT
jgi:hypothetical protein